MLERLAISIVLIAFGLAVYCVYQNLQLRRLGALKPADDPILSRLQGNIPAIVYFTTPGCIPCKTQQQPALARLIDDLADQIQILQIDATQEPEVASKWGVMTAPTTFVLDANGKTYAINYGVADANKLKRQLSSA